MGAIKDAVTAMREVLLLTEKVDRVGVVLKELAKEVRDQDRRLIRMETIVELSRESIDDKLP
jgi:hypothetical protein